ncbi:methylaspartate mutase [Streptomyces sp. NBC_01498]|uniref:methylaspartate mutase n=1 Tax=Streptomyces sp. NBC_01498 TaxID=2975870 RepID=UPI002E7B9B72|nr:methylaspartate mutase [Streptomyces sp. NBC_01498]WTL23188.1 methylaspartate mutase [Streptomyces sp. NBC_01498]
MNDAGSGAHGTGFGAFVGRAHAAGHLVVQPRMGMSDPAVMRAGLLATREAHATTVGTLTLDSYTRVGDLESAELALLEGVALNGYPLVSHGLDTTRSILDGVLDADFPVQVRHGSAVPEDIFKALMAADLDASEGGPVSYCLPYGRTPLAQSVANWARSTALFASARRPGLEPHLETFGGCMLGQLCPPSLLVAISALEARFFYEYGLRSISVSYAQQTHRGQDREAVAALRRLCTELLPDAQWHVVVYAYMGLYPQTPSGTFALLGQAAELAVATGAARLIVKTVSESLRIPTIEENVSALEHASAVAARTVRGTPPDADSETYAEASALVEAVMNLGPDVGHGLLTAFARGYLDVPYCLHPDNTGLSRSYLDEDGRLRWAVTGKMPLTRTSGVAPARSVSSAELLSSLSYIRRTFDSGPAGDSSAEERIAPRGA